jgi:hypothetical protein
MIRPAPVIDSPSCDELLLLVADFLVQELAPAQSDAKLRYRALVAANLLRIARREIDGWSSFEVDTDGRAVVTGLIERAGSLRAFAEDLEHGRRSLTDAETFALASRYVEAKLKIAMPEILNR